MKPILMSTLSLLTLMPLTTSAGDDHRHVQHDAHVHGAATLQLILQGNELEMEFHSPAMNIVGFEHAAATADEKQKIQDALATLRQAGELFSFSGTRCQLTDVEAELDRDDHDDDHGHDDDHDQHHDDHKEDHADEHAAAHSEFEVDYRFRCDDGSRLSAIEVKLPARFSGIQKLDAEWILNDSQGAAELTANAATIKVK